MANTFYISPSGNDSTGAGTLASPWKTLTKGWNAMVGGDTLYLRGGTYPSQSQTTLSGKSGTSGNLTKVWRFPGDPQPVFDFTASTDTNPKTGLQYQSGNFVHFKGFRITGIPQINSGYNYGMLVLNCNDSIFEWCEFDHIGGDGFTIGASERNLILNCDAHHCQDPLSPAPYNGSNGFSSTAQVPGTTANNIFRNCRAWWCCDDGFDTFKTMDFVTFDGCWAFWNGYIPGTFTAAGNGDGFKVGQAQSLSTTNLRLYKNNLSFENRFMGFDQNFTGDSLAFPVTLYNNTAFGNKGLGYFFSLNPAYILKNNLAYTNNNSAQQAQTGSGTTHNHNSWDSAVTLSNADFLSVSSTGADGARQSDGSLPVMNFMKLATGSDLIDAGVDVGLPFIGSAPDMGCYEYNPSGTTTTTTAAPTTTTTTAAPTTTTTTTHAPTTTTTTTVAPTTTTTTTVPTTTTTTTTTSTTTTTTIAPTPVPFPFVSGSYTESPAQRWGPGTGFGLSGKFIAGNGYYRADYSSTANQDALIAFDLNNNLENYTGFDYVLYVAPSGGQYTTIEGGVAFTASGVVAVAGDMYRLNRVGTTITAEYYRAGVWTVIYTFPVTTAANLYLKGAIPDVSKFLLNPKGLTLQNAPTTTTTSTSTTTTTTAAPTTTTTTSTTTTTTHAPTTSTTTTVAPTTTTTTTTTSTTTTTTLPPTTTTSTTTPPTTTTTTTHTTTTSTTTTTTLAPTTTTSTSTTTTTPPTTTTSTTHTTTHTTTTSTTTTSSSTTTTTTIAGVPTLVIKLVTKKNACRYGANGAITVTATGGLPPYSFSINGGAYQASGAFTKLRAGTYVLRARDQRNYVVSLTITIKNQFFGC